MICKKVTDGITGELHGYRIQCPGCKRPHVLTTGWTFNGNWAKPTFTPSLLVSGTYFDDAADKSIPFVCHSFITDGRIQFLSDCTHELKGQTVDLPETTSRWRADPEL